MHNTWQTDSDASRSALNLYETWTAEGLHKARKPVDTESENDEHVRHTCTPVVVKALTSRVRLEVGRNATL